MTIKMLDESRKDWIHLLGKVHTFRGVVDRFGHKHRQGSQIKRGATLCLTDVHLKYSNKIIDHAWIDYSPKLAKFGEYLKPGTIIEFKAVVSTYDKGGKNIYGKGVGTYQDLELIKISHVKIIKSRPVVYDDLIDDQLISYAIKTRTNIKHGTYLGVDPQKRLGKIYIGQTFANKVAKYLSWKWNS